MSNDAVTSVLYVRLPCKKVYPGGAVTLADYVHKGCPDVRQRILDLSLVSEQDAERTLREEVAAFGPDVVAFSWRDIQVFAPHQDDSVVGNAFRFYYSPNPLERAAAALEGVKAVFQYDKGIRENLRLIKGVHRLLPGRRIVVGGPAFSVFPDELIMKLPEGIIGVFGEGEPAITAIVRGEDPLQHQVLIKRDGQVVRGKRSDFLDIASGTATDYDYIASIFPGFAEYTDDHIGVQTKRGCTQKCLYCLYRVVEGPRIRYRDPKVIGQEMEDLQRKFGVKKIWLTDATLCPTQETMPFVESVLDEIIARGLKIEWQGYIRIEHLTPSFAKKMIDSGIGAFELSLTSGSQAVVDGLKLDFQWDDIWRACQMIKDAGYTNQPIIINYALNAPGETKDTLRESLASLHRFREIFGRENVQPFIFFLAVQARTGLEKLAIRQGMLPEKYDRLALTPKLIKGLIYNPPPLDKMIARAYLEACKGREEADIGNEMFRILEKQLGE